MDTKLPRQADMTKHFANPVPFDLMNAPAKFSIKPSYTLAAAFMFAIASGVIGAPTQATIESQASGKHLITLESTNVSSLSQLYHKGSLTELENNFVTKQIR